MYELDRSASKGVMTVRPPIYVFKHVGTDSDAAQRARQARLGCCPAQTLFEQAVHVEKDSDAMAASETDVPRGWAHYRVGLDRDAVPDGVELIEIASTADLSQLDG